MSLYIRVMKGKHLICKDSYIGYLTAGKSYEIIKETPRGYLVKTDTDEVLQVDKSRFVDKIKNYIIK